PDETELPFLKNEISKLGPWKREQVLVLCVFIITAAFWILKDVVNKLSGLDINDSAIALTGAMLLFVLPSNQKSSDNALEADELVHQHKGLLTWKDTIKMEWGILLMFGGGIALAKQLQSAGLLSRLGNALAVVTPDNLFLIIIVIASISVFLSEIMSNIAQVIVLSPIVVSLAESLHLSPLILGIPMCMAASCSGMLPMGTPPNAIVYGSGLVPLRKMLQAGLWINLISILVISIWTWLFLLKIF
ncbi:MAG TPA: SLC13 family permease, partial [Saprospiraceae bacterium]|nr:SLC13 family permease [Saprospiraceae bacterium]